jgi:N-acetyltransferase 10
VSQALALFTKIMRKVSKRLIDIKKAAINASLPSASEPSGPVLAKPNANWKPVETTMDEELEEAGGEVTRALREKQRDMINSLDISR